MPDTGACTHTALAKDLDGDGFGDPRQVRDVCVGAAGFVTDGTDCDDTSATSHPGGVEVWALNNLTVGHGEVHRPATGRFDGNRVAGRGELIEIGGLPLRLTTTSPLRGTVRPRGESVHIGPCEGTRHCEGTIDASSTSANIVTKSTVGSDKVTCA